GAPSDWPSGWADCQSGPLTEVVLAAVPRCSWADTKPGCCFMNAASPAHASRKRPVSAGAMLNWLIRTTGPPSSCTCCSRLTWSSISRSFIVSVSFQAGPGRHLQPVAQVTQQARGGGEVRELQPGGKLVDPADLPPVEGLVLLAAQRGQPDERRAAVIEVLAGLDQPLGPQPVDRGLDGLPGQAHPPG